jgi:hypothetical protein
LKAATRPARAAPSSASPSRSIPASAKSWRWARRLNAKKPNGIFSAMSPHLPAAGEMVLFDRSWYNRAGVERVMGFCTDAQYQEFLLTCPEFERMLVRSGIILIKYWFSVSDAEQERRFQDRMTGPPSAGRSAPWTSSRASTGPITPAPRTICSTDRPQAGPMVCGQRGRQESRAAQRDSPSAVEDSLQGSDSRTAWSCLRRS